MKMLICKHRDCDTEFIPDKKRYKFCCKDCYRLERNKALYDKNQAKKKRQYQADQALLMMAEEGDEFAIAVLQLRQLEKEYEEVRANKKLCSRIRDYFGGDIGGEYTSQEIADFFGMKKSTVDKIIKKFVDDVKSRVKLRT